MMKQCKGKKLMLPMTMFVAALLCLLQLVGESLCNTNSWNVLFTHTKQSAVQFLLLFIVVYAGLVSSIHWLDRQQPVGKKQLDKRLFWIALLVIALCWLPGIMIDYPGSYGADALNQLEGFYGYEEFREENPFHTWLMVLCISIGKFLGNRTFGYFLYILVQAGMLAGAGALVCAEVDRLTGPSRMGFYLSTAFFALVPFWSAFAQWATKDVPYTALITVWLVLLMRCLEERKHLRWQLVAQMLVVGLFACWMRLNGIYAILPTLFLLIFAMPRGRKWWIALGMGAIFMIYNLVGQAVKPELCSYEQGVRLRGLIQRNQAQQVMRCVVDHGEELTSEQIRVIDAVMEYDRIPELYSPTNTDPVDIVRRETTEEAIAEFQKLWLELLKEYPFTCIQAFLNKSYGYYSACGIGYLNLYRHENPPDPRLELGKVFPQSWMDHLWEWTNQVRGLPILRRFSTAGLYTQVAVLCGWLLLRKRKWMALIPVLPFAVNVLVCMAGPLARLLRYALPMAAGAPLLMAWVIGVLRGKILEDCSAKKETENV